MTENKPTPRRFLPPWLYGPWGGVALATILYTLVYIAWLYFHWGGEENVTLIGDLIYLPIYMMTSAVLLRTATRPELDPRQRRAWWFLGLANIAYLAGDLTWAYFENVLNEPPFPSIADVFYLSVIPLMLAGLLNLTVPTQFRRRYDRQRYWLDLGITTLAATILIWYFVVADTLVENAGDLLTLLFAVAYPVGDLILIVALLAVLLRRPDPNTRSVLEWVLAALFCFVGSDLAFAYTSLLGTYSTGSMLDAGWVVAFFFFALAALRQLYKAPIADDPLWFRRMDQIGRWILWGMVVLALGVVVYLGLVTGFEGAELPWYSIGTFLILLLVGWRFLGTRSYTDMSIGTKILLLSIGSVLVTALTLVAVVAWQSGQYGLLVQDEFGQLVDDDLEHITDGIYNMVKAQDELVQQMVDSSLNVARQELKNAGQVSLAEDKAQWTAVNQFTQQPLTVQLPKMLVGVTWLSQNTNPSIRTPIVDDVQSLVGGTATIFQRMNEQGDMLRVATNVPTSDGLRATGTYIPAIMPDGSPNPVVSTVLAGETYRGTAKVVNAWYDTAYEPILDETGRVIGMLYVGVKQQNVESLRQAILETKVGKTGYVYVLGSDGNDRGRYIISKNGAQDGIGLWEIQDAEGNYVIQMIVNTALSLKPGETATVRYLWKNPDDTAPRWKIARLAYYEPWHWVIGASTYEDELAVYQGILQEGQLRMVLFSGAIGLGIALLISFLGVLISRSVSRPIGQLANIAAQIAAGNLDITAQVEQRDEIGLLAKSFNEMTAKLRESLGGLRRQATQIATVSEVSRRLSASTNPRQLALEVVEQLQSAFNYYHAHIYFVDESTGNLILVGGTGEAGAVLMASGHKILKGRGLVGRAAETNTPVLVPDVSKAEGWLPNPILPDTKSEVAVPISSGQKVLGVLDVQQNEVNGLGEEDVQLLQSLTTQIAISLQNARAFEQTKEQSHLELLVNVIGQKIQRATTVEDTLQTAIREIGLALGASRVCVNIGGRQDDGDDFSRN